MLGATGSYVSKSTISSWINYPYFIHYKLVYCSIISATDHWLQLIKIHYKKVNKICICLLCGIIWTQWPRWICDGTYWKQIKNVKVSKIYFPATVYVTIYRIHLQLICRVTLLHFSWSLFCFLVPHFSKECHE